MQLSDQDQLLDYRTRVYSAYRSSDIYGRQMSKGKMDPSAYFRLNFSPYLPKDRNATIVDVACGSGELVRFLTSEGYGKVLGVDLSSEQAKLARSQGINRIVETDAFEFLRSHREDLDVILALDFMEHLRKDEVLQFLDLSWISLRSGGKLIVQTSNALSPFFGRYLYGDFTHELSFTPRSVAQLFSLAGFSPLGVFETKLTGRTSRRLVRSILWRVVKTLLRLCIAIETGVTIDNVFSQNLIAVAEKVDGASKNATKLSPK